jgi:hypothetical protein
MRQQQQQAPLVKQQQTPQQQQQTEKMKGKAEENIEGDKSSGEKVKEKTTEPIRQTRRID